MASYVELQELVAQLAARGEIRQDQQPRDIKQLYLQLKQQGLWGRPRGKFESPYLFAFECALQVWGCSFWPTRRDLKLVPRDAELVSELRGTERWKNYEKVRQLFRGQILPLAFYVDYCALCAEPEGREMDKRYRWSSRYAAARRAGLDGAAAAKAMALMTEAPCLRWADDAMFASKLPPAKRELFLACGADRYAYTLLAKNIASPEFVTRYQQAIRHSLGTQERDRLLRAKKLSINPLWERLPPSIAIKLYAGETPRGLTIQGRDSEWDVVELTKGEAHLWLEMMASLESLREQEKLTSRQFLAGRLGINAADLAKFRSCSRQLLIWYARKKDNPAMTKERVIYGPGGERRSFCFRDLLDEISAADLVVPDPANPDGPGRLQLNRAPEEVFAAAARRRYELYLQRHATNQALPQLAGVVDPTGAITPIVDTLRLLNEGEDLNHCVGGYADACLQKRSYIFAVSTSAGRSTFEVCPAGQAGAAHGYELAGLYAVKQGEPGATPPQPLAWRLAQHYGHANGTPPAENTAAVIRWCRANGISLPAWLEQCERIAA